MSFSISYLGDLRSSGILRSVEGYFRSDVSGRFIDLIFKGKNFFLTLEDGTNRLSGKVGSYVDRIYVETEALNHASYFHVSKGYYRQMSVY